MEQINKIIKDHCELLNVKPKQILKLCLPLKLYFGLSIRVIEHKEKFSHHIIKKNTVVHYLKYDGNDRIEIDISHRPHPVIIFVKKNKKVEAGIVNDFTVFRK